MKTYLIRALALVALCLSLVAAASGQEVATKISLKDPTFRIEAGKELFKIEDALSLDILDFRFWAGAGTTIGDDGRVVGSVAALWAVPKAAKNLKVEIGPEYRGMTGKKPAFDFVAQFALDKEQSAGLSLGPSGAFGLFYSRRL